jgi:hypothetical protein
LMRSSRSRLITSAAGVEGPQSRKPMRDPRRADAVVGGATSVGARSSRPTRSRSCVPRCCTSCPSVRCRVRVRGGCGDATGPGGGVPVPAPDHDVVRPQPGVFLSPRVSGLGRVLEHASTDDGESRRERSGGPAASKVPI